MVPRNSKIILAAFSFRLFFLIKKMNSDESHTWTIHNTTTAVRRRLAYTDSIKLTVLLKSARTKRKVGKSTKI